MRRTVLRYARIVTVLMGAVAVGPSAGRGAGGGGTSGGAAPEKQESGESAANVVQTAPVKQVTVGDISVGYRVIGPLADAAEATGTGETKPLLLSLIHI